ncbi:MAG: NADH-quinone oxidoreductase subunit C [Acidobacteriaceae bacterium]
MNLEEIKSQIEANVPGCSLQILLNGSPSGQHSLLVDKEHALTVASFLRDGANPRFDYCSNVTGVDWPPKETSTKQKTKKMVDGVETEVEEVIKTVTGNYLEVVYHLFSMDARQGPLVLRMRTEDRENQVHLPSLTPVWRSAEFQEREVYDLFGIIFDGHPDLRRLLMWDGFTDHPMRKDYVDPDDYEYEPTAHDEVLKRMQAHYAAQEAPSGSEETR